MNIVLKLLRRLVCFTGYHFHGKWNKDGIMCEDCKKFSSKYEIQGGSF